VTVEFSAIGQAHLYPN